ncbi:unnamed protein product [Tenebrio molitor]|nr:unnamed protein product [Tenebrio molitor]
MQEFFSNLIFSRPRKTAKTVIGNQRKKRIAKMVSWWRNLPKRKLPNVAFEKGNIKIPVSSNSCRIFSSSESAVQNPDLVAPYPHSKPFTLSLIPLPFRAPIVESQRP